MSAIFFIRLSLFIIGLILFADAVLLLSYRKIHLGIILPLLIGLIFCAYACFYLQIQQWLKQHLTLKKFWRFGWGIFSVWLITLFAFFIFLTVQIQNSQSIPPVKSIIVLGSGIENGKPSAALAKRLDTAAPLAKTQPKALLILTGGLDFGETKTEAAIMAQYLQQHYALPFAQMALENQSTSTELNLKNSQAILTHHQIQLTDPIAIVTSDFHTIRAKAIAQKQGYSNVYLIAAPTPLLIRYNAWLREYFAYLSGWVLNEY
ncbi:MULTISPECIES: YdcF family protein [unclassified Acinetobacter]|uniref:YdcF family protein n=1 Tax=unclassified Acinetobacter TaxID=196816 RepID=UPI00190D0896|nr:MULTISPECIES: YdcF family protein [unclassified Acinetobacter]MBK0064941.1 YdcF family protein [Acinetobacter sp. S55]MBK0068236.1 YdcF family protein [Acinetobacter sp. S54]